MEVPSQSSMRRAALSQSRKHKAVPWILLIFLIPAALGAYLTMNKAAPCGECHDNGYIDVSTYNKDIKDYWVDRFPCRTCLSEGKPEAIRVDLERRAQETRKLQSDIKEIENRAQR